MCVAFSSHAVNYRNVCGLFLPCGELSGCVWAFPRMRRTIRMCVAFSSHSVNYWDVCGLFLACGKLSGFVWPFPRMRRTIGMCVAFFSHAVKYRDVKWLFFSHEVNCWDVCCFFLACGELSGCVWPFPRLRGFLGKVR